MRREEKGKVKIVRKKLRGSLGMTMAELLIVVGIIVALSGVGFIAVWNYQRSLGQLERDGIAKEIFVAAQNHLTAAYGEGYLGVEETESYIGIEDSEGAHYFVVNGDTDEDSVLEQMLPFGSIDETVRAGGSYIIRYQKDTGLVLDVFYCTRSGSPSQFNHELSTKDYSTVLGMKDTDDVSYKSARRNWDGAILGWYGGADAATLAELELEAPTIAVTNAEKLYVTVTDPNYGTSGAMLKLIVEGLSSGAKKAITLYNSDGEATDDRITATSGTYTVVLDDVTTSGCHFAELAADSGTFIPGENIKIKAVAYSTSALANICYSGSGTTNSLFVSLSDADSDTSGVLETVGINNIRHLENLDPKVSNLGSLATTSDSDLETFSVASAVQTADMDWEAFQTAAGTQIYYSEGTTYSASKYTASGNYYPISPDYSLTYDGNNHSISNIQASAADAGLFGSTATVSAISNLELVDFSVTGTTSAGALAGTLENCAVMNVVAYGSEGQTTSTSTSTGTSTSAGTSTSTGSTTPAVSCSGGMAGGLIGYLIDSGSSVTASAAALIVEGGSSAGGLIGTVSGSPAILLSYSGGHTDGGAYDDTSYNVTASAGTAGGLIGVADAATISYSYSTCSASGSSVSGGLVGSASGTITNCYCTGLVDDDEDNAFIGSNSATISGCYYYEIINEVLTYDDTDALAEVGYKGSGGGDGVTALDVSVDSTVAFAGSSDSWETAQAYDSVLRQYYAGKYSLKTVEQLGESVSLPEGYSWTVDFTDTSLTPFVVVHYGDWPAPELFVTND